jgi:uncharacterized protein
MIEPKEINKIATINKVSDRQIEKDYIISWVLFAISKNEKLFKTLVFKGGTLLKKAYIEDYRFSEDLDFTLLDETVSNEQILEEFKSLFIFMREEANIEMQIDVKNWTIPEAVSPQFYINYVGPLKGNMGSRDLKIDITRGEILETDIEIKSILSSYSDLNEDFSLQCYSLVEVLIEKMTALMGRSEPRDFYDFWYLTEIEEMKISDNIIYFQNKAERKNHKPTEFVETLLRKTNAFKSGWEHKLTSQIHNLPKFDKIFREVKRHLKF